MGRACIGLHNQYEYTRRVGQQHGRGIYLTAHCALFGQRRWLAMNVTATPHTGLDCCLEVYI
jgi:hypothetical protein